MKLVRLIEMCLHETYSRVRIGKHLSDTFPIQNGLKQGDAAYTSRRKLPVQHRFTSVALQTQCCKRDGVVRALV
jgi:hypothetical protein